MSGEYCNRGVRMSACVCSKVSQASSFKHGDPSLAADFTENPGYNVDIRRGVVDLLKLHTSPETNAASMTNTPCMDLRPVAHVSSDVIA